MKNPEEMAGAWPEEEDVDQFVGNLSTSPVTREVNALL
jgi:hypothetical protein